MGYKLIVSPRAQKEIENAIDYETLKITPLFRIRYKDVRALKIKKFPYSIYFIVHKNQSVVRILSFFHNKRNPNKRPEY